MFETGSVNRMKKVKTRWIWAELTEAAVLAKFWEDEHASTRSISRQEGMRSPSTIQRILKEKRFHSYKMQHRHPIRSSLPGNSGWSLLFPSTLPQNFTLPVPTTRDLQAFKETDEVWQRALDRINDSHTQSKIDNQRKIKHKMLAADLVDPKKVLDEGKWANFRGSSSLLFRHRHELNKKLDAKRLKESNTLKLNQQKAEASSNQIHPNSLVDALSPYNRQRIAYLYCANGKKASTARTFCMGTFLTNYCFNPEYKCKGCDRSMMLEHLRRIVHRNARIEIATHVIVKGNSSSALEDLNTEDLPSSIPNINCPSIICWRRCPICWSNSCIVPLPEAVYHLSFAKFVDYLANATHWISSFPASSTDGDEVKECQHCTFHDHHHYFAYQNYITTFKVIAIRPLHVIFSPMIAG
uniref:C2H2-type domain-containing protein n=1 Tax=Ditylenchus dipsaci TaxID=166011 RepID=A0A915E920_9BILA